MLKLYRDCSGAAFPANVTIDVMMANGQAFTPSRNFTMPGGSITNITPLLPPCATSPTPMPCVEERIYTSTVNLAAHPGGMHLAYGLCCRNNSISNILTPGAEGETFYAFIPCYNKAWSEDFTLANGTTVDAGTTAWTRTLGTTPPTSAQVNNGMFEIVGSNNGSVEWVSQSINISGFASGVNLSANLERAGTNFGNNDSLRLFYSINGGPKVAWAVNGTNVGAWASPRFATATALVGNTIQIYIRAKFNNNNNSTGKTFRVDMVNVYDNTFLNNSSPYFNALPPLLLCATNPFNLNMSATDADGDVLVYSMYTPYDDNPVPTYPNNLFTPNTVTWTAGFSAISPFNNGGPNVTLNPTTGFMTGVANTLGQYVFGVKVQEFRSGVLLSEVVRDYQVNTVTCPPFVPAAPIASANSPICAGQTLSLSATFTAGATYNWTGPNGFTSTLLNPTIVGASTLAAGVYSVTATVAGCTSPPGTVAVVVNPIPTTPTATANSPICAGQTLSLFSSTVTGATYNWTGPNAFTSALQNPTIPGATTLAAGVYSVTSTVSGCTSGAGTVNVVVNPLPASPTAGANSPLCAGNTLSLTASTIAGATYVWAGPNSFTSAVQNPTIPGATTLAAGVYSVSAIVAGCPGPIGTVSVTINPAPAAPTAGSNSPLCAGNTLNLTASAIAGATYSWTGPNAFTSTLQNPTIVGASTLAAGVYSVRATVAGCQGPAGTTTVVVNPAPAAPTAGGTATLCAGSTINLTASAIAGATYNWTGPNSFTSNVQNPTIPGASTLATGMYSVTATVAGCPGPAGTFSVTVFGIPGAPTLGSNSPLCTGNTLSLTASTIVGASYSWTGPNAFTSTLQNPTIAAATTAASGTYSVSVNVSGCGSAASTIAVVVNPTPAAPTAGSNSPLCAGQTINLTASNIAGATYSWTGPNSFTSTTQNPSIPGASTLAAGVYTVRATVAGCTSPNGTVNVVVNPIPASPTLGSNSPICAGQTLSLTASTIAGATYTWTGPSGFTTNTQNPNIVNAQPTNSGTYVASVSVAGCTSPTISITVTVNPLPAAPSASANSPLCALSTLSLSAGTIASATYSWTGPNSFTSTTQNPSIPSVTTTASGIYSVTANVLGCAGPAGTVAVTVNPTPAAPTAGGTSTLCAGNNINLTASNIAGATYNWNGPNGFTSTLQNPTITGASTLATGVYSVNATVGGCTGPAGTFSVTVFGIPSPPTLASNSPICAGQTLSLTATTIVGASYSWTGPNSFSSTLQNPTISGVTLAAAGTYSVLVNVSGCGSAVSTIAVSVNPTPAAPTAGSNSPLCAGSTINLTASNIAGATYNWSGPNSFTSTTQNPSIPGASTLSAGVYSVNVNVAGCTGPNGTVNVVVNPIPVSPTANSNSPLCVGQTISLTASPMAGASYSWSGPNSFTSTLQNPTIPGASTLAAGVYSVTATVAGCTGSAGTVSVSVNIPPVAPTASANSPICAGQTLSLTASTIAGATYSWTGPASFTSTSQNPTIPTATTSSAGTYSVIALVGGCAGPAGVVTVTINPAPAAPTAGGTATLCAGSNINLSASTIAGATYNWTGPNGFTSTVQNPTITAATTSATGVYSVNATVAGCPGPAGTVSVTVYGIPGPPTLGSNSPVCAGQTLSLTANTILGATYIWSGPNSFTSAVQNPTLAAVTIPASGTYSVAISVMGCGSALATTAVTVNPLPAAPVANSNAPLCTGATLSLTASNIPGATSYSWTGPNSFTSTTQNPTLPTTTTLSAGIYSVSAVALGCAGPAGTVSVAVNDVPNVVATSNSTVCIGATLNLFASNIAGATYTWTGPNSFSATTQNPSIPGATTLAIGVYSVQANVGGCIGPVSTTSVMVSPPPAPPTASSSSPLCAGDTLFLFAAPVAGATYTWSGPNSFTATTQNPNVPNIPMSGAGVYSVAVNVAGCQGPFGTITVTVNPSPAPPVASNSSPICISGTLNLTASNIAGATYNWVGPNSFTSTTQNPTIPGATTIAAGSYSVYATVAGCTSTAAITIATITMPATLSAGNNATVCSNNVPLTGTCSTGSGTWTTSGTGVFAPNSLTGNYVPSAADISAGTVTLTLTSTNNGACAPATSSVVLSILPGPTANAGSDVTVCANNATVALTGSVTLATGGQWTSSGTGTFNPNNTSLNTNYIPSNADTTAGTVTIYLTTTGNGICSATIDSLVINFNSAPLVVAGGTVSVCKNNPVAVLSGYSSTGSATWTSLGTGTLSSTSVFNPTYTPSTADTTAGSVQLILTSGNNGNCNPVSDTVTIVYSSPPTITAGSTQTVCSNNPAVTLSGVSSTSTGTWTTSGSGSFAPNTINGTYIPSAADISAGTVTLTVTSTNNGGCNPVTSTVNVSIIPGPTSDAGVDLTVCANTTSIALSGSVTVATGGTWATNGTGTFSPGNSLTTTYIPSTADTTAGSVTIYLTTTGNGICLQEVDSMVITFQSAPSISAGNNIFVCKNQTSVNLNATTTVPSVTWTTLGSGTFNPSNVGLTTSYFPSTADTTAGSVTIYVTSDGNAFCSGAVDTLTIFFQGPPLANFLANNKCVNAATTFTDMSTVASGTIVSWNWNFGAAGTSTVQNPSVTFTATGTQTVSLTVSTGCLDSITKVVYINPNPVASFSFTELCHDSAVFFGNGSVNPGTITGWNWNFGDTTGSTLQNPIHLYPDTGTYIVTLTVMSDSGCVASALDTIHLKKCANDITVTNPAVPSGFTPNGDGKNDILYVKGGPLSEMNFRIYNEWGNEVFKSTEQSNGWNGNFRSAPQPSGRYLWILTGKLIDGRDVKMQGEVILSR